MRWPSSKDGGWHRWFAWHPVRFQDRTWCWLETVEREWGRHGWCWAYRVIVDAGTARPYGIEHDDGPPPADLPDMDPGGCR